MILQFLVDVAVDFSCMERFLLQPIKSVVLQIFQHIRNYILGDIVVTIKEQPL